jgi:hypothetical protein
VKLERVLCYSIGVSTDSWIAVRYISLTVDKVKQPQSLPRYNTTSFEMSISFQAFQQTTCHPNAERLRRQHLLHPLLLALWGPQMPQIMQPIASFACCGLRALRKDVAEACCPVSTKKCHLQLIFHIDCAFGTQFFITFPVSFRNMPGNEESCCTQLISYSYIYKLITRWSASCL